MCGSNLLSHSGADIAKSLAYGKRLEVYPRSQAANPPKTKFTDANDVLYDPTIPYDVRFFQSLDRIVPTEPWLTRDKAMIDQLKSIGIEKGKPFIPDAATTGILNAAAAEARDVLDRMYDRSFSSFHGICHKGGIHLSLEPRIFTPGPIRSTRPLDMIQTSNR